MRKGVLVINCFWKRFSSYLFNSVILKNEYCSFCKVNSNISLGPIILGLF